MKYRSIHKVIEAIRKEVPKTFEEHDRIMSAFDDVLDSAKYRAPEAYGVNYDQLSQYLGAILGEPDSDWKEKVADIFADKIKIKGMVYFEWPPN